MPHRGLLSPCRTSWCTEKVDSRGGRFFARIGWRGIGTGTTHTTSKRLLVDNLIKAEAGAKSCFFITFVPVKQLEDITEFRSSPELVEKLYTHGILKTYKAGSVILNENSYIRSIPIVIKGVMKVIRTEDDGREILLYYIKAGESCAHKA